MSEVPALQIDNVRQYEYCRKQKFHIYSVHTFHIIYMRSVQYIFISTLSKPRWLGWLVGGLKTISSPLVPALLSPSLSINLIQPPHGFFHPHLSSFSFLIVYSRFFPPFSLLCMFSPPLGKVASDLKILRKT